MEKGVILDNNFINEVIFRIDFSTIFKLSGNDESAADQFKENILTEFPKFQVISHDKINLDIDINSGQRKISEKGDLVWIFKSNDYKKEVALTANELVLDYKKEAYCGFNKFLSDVLLLINALSGYGSFDLKFLGLRYINQFDDDEINKNLVKYFNSDLLNLEVLKNLENNDENLVQIFTKLNFRKENYLLTLQYGLFNPKFPDYEVNKEFILDFDCVIKDIDSIDDIKSNLIKMNKLIFSKFEYSISSELVRLMKNKEIK